MPYIAQLYFKTAIVFLIVGVAAGLQMAISGNHNVIGAHAHINLLGWVTSALFGAYYALNPVKAERRLAVIQYGAYTTGVVVLTVSLYFMLLLANPSLEPLVAIASLVVLTGVILFAAVVFSRDEDQRAVTNSTVMTG
jgi:peptidoglycan/LPS O-acetylase OafA/YrhL